MSLKCLKNFPQEYFKKTAFMVKHIFSYSGFMITLLVFVFIEKISQFLYDVKNANNASQKEGD